MAIRVRGACGHTVGGVVRNVGVVFPEPRGYEERSTPGKSRVELAIPVAPV